MLVHALNEFKATFGLSKISKKISKLWRRIEWIEKVNLEDYEGSRKQFEIFQMLKANFVGTLRYFYSMGAFPTKICFELALKYNMK